LFKNNYDQVDTNFLPEFGNIKLLNAKRLNELIDDDIVYVITTSGTTGSPKVIQACNSSIMPNIIQLSELFDLKSGDRVYQASSLTFDPSLIELFCSLLKKCTLLILPQMIKLMPHKLDEYLTKYNINILQVYLLFIN
jgi:D-alanine--poly(phosphoribitol) ligase subunit 1